MSISQISVFLQSEPGHLEKILNLFRAHEINVRGFCAADTGDFGITRFIVSNPSRALEVLEGSGFACLTKSVIGIKLADSPGNLLRVMSALSHENINIEYCYSLISTYIALTTDDDVLAAQVLTDAGFTLLKQGDIPA